jgi:glutamate synthase (NADPH/NADH) small chain
MDCGVPLCHQGCPLGNLIPDWNDLVYKGDWAGALQELHRTNNFPDVTGRVCPAPCETVCVLGINAPPVAIKSIEKSIIDWGWAEGVVKPEPAARQTWKRVAVVGSGPAGLAGAQQLARQGHQVTVFEKSDRLGGLLCYGIPDFKMERHIIDRRVEQMVKEGVDFRTSIEVGRDISGQELKKSFDAVLLAGGAQEARLLGPEVEGRDLGGIHLAMDFLTQQNRRNRGEKLDQRQDILATGKRVLILGGGDTGADCLGTSHRQGAKEIHQFEILPKPKVVKSGSSHEEGGIRRWSVMTKAFKGGNGHIQELSGCEVEWVTGANGKFQMKEVSGTAFTQPVDLVLLAMGFLGPIKTGMIEQLGVELNDRGAVKRDANYMTSVPGVFTAGDMNRGASLVVWAIWEGREAARCIDEYLARE